jgi:hypothetical protein
MLLGGRGESWSIATAIAGGMIQSGSTSFGEAMDYVVQRWFVAMG